MTPEALPPCRHIRSTSISTSAANSLLATYLSNSESHPHLHPDALITPSGVTFSSHGGPMGGVIMHNLRRVAAGLRGEYLEPEKTPEPEEANAESQDNESRHGRGGLKGKRRQEEVNGVRGGVGGGVDDGWQDKSEYEREQGGVEAGEVGERDTGGTSGGDAPEVEVTGGAERGEEVGKKRKNKEDKEARKKAKKERDQERKREKNKQD